MPFVLIQKGPRGELIAKENIEMETMVIYKTRNQAFEAGQESLLGGEFGFYVVDVGDIDDPDCGIVGEAYHHSTCVNRNLECKCWGNGRG